MKNKPTNQVPEAGAEPPSLAPISCPPAVFEQPENQAGWQFVGNITPGFTLHHFRPGVKWRCLCSLMDWYITLFFFREACLIVQCHCTKKQILLLMLGCWTTTALLSFSYVTASLLISPPWYWDYTRTHNNIPSWSNWNTQEWKGNSFTFSHPILFIKSLLWHKSLFICWTVCCIRG